MANLFRSRATLTAGGVPCLITTYWAPDTGVSDTQCATEAMARVRAMFNSAAGLIAAGSTLTFDPAVQILDETTGTLVGVAVGSTPAAVAFTQGSELLPLQTQGLARFSTSAFIRGRALKGRMYLPGVCEVHNQGNGVPGGAYTSGWATALGLLGTTVVSSIFQNVWSRPSTPGGSDGSISPVTGRTVATSWAVQKGRRA